MNVTDLLTWMRGLPPWVVTAGVVVFLIACAWSVRRLIRSLRNRDAAWVVDVLATVVGLGWSSQGMWETATGTYHVVPRLAVALFFVFESMMVSQMIRAHRYRHDRARRARFIRAVWVVAVVMGCIVALAEGWTQAPLRLAVPLLVAYTWWLGETADDDPSTRPATSWRLTWRRIGLALKLLDETEKDARTINRDRLTRRIRDLSFAEAYGWAWVGDLTRRRIRLARLRMLADSEILADVDAALARAADVMAGPIPEQETEPEIPVDDQPAEPEIVIPDTRPEPDPAPEVPPADTPETDEIRRPQGVHKRGGQWLRGQALIDDGVTLMLRSVSPERPTGMTNTELALSYDPPLRGRKAEEIGAKARSQIVAPSANGHRIPVG